MTTRQLWELLLTGRSPFPLFIRLAPRAHRPQAGSIWRFLAWYTFLGLYASVFAAPFMFQSVTLGVLFVVFGSPAFIIVLMALVCAPFVIFGGLFFALRFANRISMELAVLQRNAMTEILQATPDGRWGLLRSVSAAALRRREIFFGAGIYEMAQAHLALALGFAFPVAFSLVLLVASRYLGYASFTVAPGNPELQGVIVVGFVALGVFPSLLAALLHVEFRQMLMLGVTAGVFGGTVMLERADAWTGAVAMLLGVLLLGAVAFCGALVLAAAMIPFGHRVLGLGLAAIAGWVVSLLSRERAIVWLWGRIRAHDELLA